MRLMFRRAFPMKERAREMPRQNQFGWTSASFASLAWPGLGCEMLFWSLGGSGACGPFASFWDSFFASSFFASGVPCLSFPALLGSFLSFSALLGSCLSFPALLGGSGLSLPAVIGSFLIGSEIWVFPGPSFAGPERRI